MAAHPFLQQQDRVRFVGRYEAYWTLPGARRYLQNLARNLQVGLIENHTLSDTSI